MKYSGQTNFDFEIERYRNKFTSELVTFNKEVEGDEFGIVFEYQTISLKVEGRSYFQSGRYSGPPEDCYPDEGDTECEAVIGPDGKDWSDKLTPDESTHILVMIEENCMDGPDDCEEEDDYEPDSSDDLDDYEEDLW